jgi:zinc/manganese transport system substrate-binding protein
MRLTMPRWPLAVTAALFLTATAVSAYAQPLAVVAAENFYGDIASQIGGADVAVTSILSNPDEDPHLFEANASTARALSAAKIVIVNGADYDPWMDKLLAAAKSAGRIEIIVADIAAKKSGDNPHLWYNPKTVEALAGRLAAEFSKADPAHAADYQAGAQKFLASLKPLDDKVLAMNKTYAGQPVTASEPVFGYMAEAVGLAMRNQRFQTAVMNNTEPSASDVAAFETDLREHKVKVMLYNAQADDQAVKRLVGIARAAHVPVVGVSETEPAGKTYQAWMLDQLTALDKALAGDNS